MSLINAIVKDNLCLGCGLCESVCGKENVEMKLSENGFFYPNVKVSIPEKEEVIDRICPGKNVVNDLLFDKDQAVWGKMEALYSGFSLDKEVRTQGSSGGIVSALAIYLLETKAVNAVLQVGGDESDYERNALKVSRNKSDVLQCASSRYAPALIFNKIDELLNDSDDVYAFIGKPCDISALKNYLTEYPQYKDRFVLTISIMCAGMPSFKGTKAIITDFKAKEPVTKLVYRGNGWPGYFSFLDSRGESFKKTYNDSWGKTLNRHLNFRCKICPDGIGIQADVAVGDAWETKDGYPDFTEKEGQSLIIVRTQRALSILSKAAGENQIVLETLAEEKIGMMQPYQYARRTRVGARLLAIYLGKGKKVVNYKNLHLFYNMKKVPMKDLFSEFKGTLKRVIMGKNVNV